MVAVALPALAWPHWPHLAKKSTPKSTAVEDKPLHLRHIAGVIVDQRGMFIPYPSVELRDGNDHHVIATSFADGNGRFHFEDHKPGERLEISFTMKGYQSAQYTIEIVHFGHQKMKAVMPQEQ